MRKKLRLKQIVLLPRCFHLAVCELHKIISITSSLGAGPHHFYVDNTYSCNSTTCCCYLLCFTKETEYNRAHAADGPQSRGRPAQPRGLATTPEPSLAEQMLLLQKLTHLRTLGVKPLLAKTPGLHASQRARPS